MGKQKGTVYVAAGAVQSDPDPIYAQTSRIRRAPDKGEVVYQLRTREQRRRHRSPEGKQMSTDPLDLVDASNHV